MKIRLFKVRKKINWFLSGLLLSITAGVLMYYFSTHKDSAKDEEMLQERMDEAQVFIDNGLCLDALQFYDEIDGQVYKETHSEIYAELNRNRGICYSKVTPQKPISSEMLTKTIISFENSLEVYTLKEFPMEHALLLSDLGFAYTSLAEFRNREENLNTAIDYYDRALNIQYFEALEDGSALESSVYYNNRAVCRYNLGILYISVAHIRDRKENLEKSDASFRQSLYIFNLLISQSRNKDLIDEYLYNIALIHLGIAKQKIDLSNYFDDKDALGDSFEYSNKALSFFSIEKYPFEHSIALSNLSSFYITSSEDGNPLIPLNMAIQDLEQALMVLKRDKYPYHYATAKVNLGEVYTALGRVSAPYQNIQLAVDAFSEALTVFTVDDYPIKYANVSFDIGTAYTVLARISKSPDDIKSAEEAYERSLEIYKSNVYPYNHKDVQQNFLILQEIKNDIDSVKEPVL